MSLTTWKKAKFRVRIEDLETKKHKVFTVYRNGKPLTLKDFEADLKKKITSPEVFFDFNNKEAIVECAWCGNIERSKDTDIFSEGYDIYPCPRCKGLNDLKPVIYAFKNDPESRCSGSVHVGKKKAK